jgi:hypothetical protein
MSDKLENLNLKELTVNELETDLVNKIEGYAANTSNWEKTLVSISYKGTAPYYDYELVCKIKDGRSIIISYCYDYRESCITSFSIKINSQNAGYTINIKNKDVYNRLKTIIESLEYNLEYTKAKQDLIAAITLL